MTRQCHCGDDADETVFGACRRCQPEGLHAANIQSELNRLEALDPPKLIPSWVFTVPAYDPAERPFETTLDADERGDR